MSAAAGGDVADYKFKILILGDAGTGKTSLSRRFALDDFQTSYLATIGIDYLERTVDVKGEKVKLQIWDTAGQERFRTLIRPYYRGAAGIALVYDVTDPTTFDHMQQWMVAIQENTSHCQIIQKVVLANKTDLLPSSGERGPRSVSREKGLALADGCKCPYFEVSAKGGQNVEEAFVRLAEMVLEASKGAAAMAARDRKDSVTLLQLPQEIPVHPRREKKCCNFA